MKGIRDANALSKVIDSKIIQYADSIKDYVVLPTQLRSRPFRTSQRNLLNENPIVWHCFYCSDSNRDNDRVHVFNWNYPGMSEYIAPVQLRSRLEIDLNKSMPSSSENISDHGKSFQFIAFDFGSAVFDMSEFESTDESESPQEVILEVAEVVAEEVNYQENVYIYNQSDYADDGRKNAAEESFGISDTIETKFKIASDASIPFEEICNSNCTGEVVSGDISESLRNNSVESTPLEEFESVPPQTPAPEEVPDTSSVRATQVSEGINDLIKESSSETVSHNCPTIAVSPSDKCDGKSDTEVGELSDQEIMEMHIPIAVVCFLVGLLSAYGFGRVKRFVTAYLLERERLYIDNLEKETIALLSADKFPSAVRLLKRSLPRVIQCR